LYLLFLLASPVAVASEQDAGAISERLRSHHMPFGTVLDPVFAGPESSEIAGYSRCGDSAIWTGHYLAAEAFRYKVTVSETALENVRAALDGLRALVDVTGTDLLARCIVPVSSPYAAGILEEEAHHGATVGRLDDIDYYWVGNTSRDQYLGVFFGLAVAFDFTGDEETRAAASALANRMLEFLLDNSWNIRMPDGSPSTTFAIRPDQQMTLLQIGRHMNPDRFGGTHQVYRFLTAAPIALPIVIESFDDHKSYFKFNLDAIGFYNLIRLETGAYRWLYDQAYGILRRTVEGHDNAHFNMIDRALRGPDDVRDAATVAQLDEWLLRTRRDPFIDLRETYETCGEDRACSPIPIRDRVHTDFLWQRSPFLLLGGGEGRIEGAGIDYLLPYWMARYYGVIGEEQLTGEERSITGSTDAQ
jgi:hypothetical protein